jgi:hypothetical protein
MSCKHHLPSEQYAQLYNLRDCKCSKLHFWHHLKFSIIVFQEIQISKEYERIWSIHSCGWIPLPTSPFCLKKVQSAVSCKKLQKERFSLKKLEYAKSRDFWVGFCQTGLNTTGATFREHAIIEPEQKIIAT